MRVITLTQQGLNEHCRRLACMIAESGYTPDVIIGIHTGGYETALMMLPHMPGTALNGYSVSRPSSRGRKRKWLHNIIQRLPLWLLNSMRIAEAYLRAYSKDPQRVAAQSTDTPIAPNTRRILVVDDAVDSGTSLRIALQMLHELCPQAEIRSAALTVTTAQPVVRPEYAIYHNHTLLRFPWSMDARQS